MSKKSSSKAVKSNPNPIQIDPETQQKQRLRSLSLSKGLLCRSPADPSAALAPASTAVRLDGRDIVKRGQRKSRYLFSFPGLLAPLSSGRVGELADLGTKNPILYLDFPNGRMKLFGTHVYPKNKYLTLQLTKSAKGVMCEDCFESLIVFSEAWWIGSKEENPDEHQLEFPKDVTENKDAEPDFKGGAGAGATFEEASGVKKPTKEYKAKSPSFDTESEEDMDEDSYTSTREDVKSAPEATPVRQSARMAGKTFNFADSSGNDSIASDAEEPETEDQPDVKIDDANALRRSILSDLEDSIPSTSTLLTSGSKLVDKEKVEQSSPLKKSKKSKEDSPSKKGTLVQSTVSNLFEKAAEKRNGPMFEERGAYLFCERAQLCMQTMVKSKCGANHSPGPKGSSAKRQLVDSNQVAEQVQVKKTNKKEPCSGGKKRGTKTVSARKKSQVMDDDTDDLSSDYPDDSDEDWAA